MGVREKMAAVHRALAFYNLNEGIDNHVTCLAKSQFRYLCRFQKFSLN